MIQLDSLKCFQAIVESGGFHAAAERLHRTQPAVSQRVRALEKQCGETLFDRRTRRPTAAGRIVLERGTALLRAAEALEAEVRESVASGGELRVGTSDTNALYFLPPRIRAFSKAMPRARVFVHCRSSDEVAQAVERGDLDCGIVTLPLRNDTLAVQSLFEQRLVVVVPRDHGLAKRSRLRVDDLDGEPMVLMQAGTRTGSQLRQFFESEGFSPTIVMDSGSFEVIKQYVSEGVGLSIIPELALRDEDARRVKAVQLPGLPRVGIGVVWRKVGHRSKSAEAFLTILLDRKIPT